MTNYLFNYTSENDNATKYGERYWGVVLSDGRFISLHADNIHVVDGSLVAYRVKEDFVENLLSIASGQWASFYAVSVLTGDPVCIDRTEGSEVKIKESI